MQIRPLAVGVVLFGILVIGGTLDGARRKLTEQPLWMAQSWRNYLKGSLTWVVVGLLAVAGGICAMLI